MKKYVFEGQSSLRLLSDDQIKLIYEKSLTAGRI